ncbi:MAG TPA: NBR1-Ig-like domain-containing protein [Anaerolineales bacterium]
MPDNTILQLNQPFTKTWRLRNSGTCTWTTGYRMVFVGGDQLSAPASVAMPINVVPAQTVDVSVNMLAPDVAGHYEGMWQIQSADGKDFGVGLAPTDRMWVRIRVIPPAYSSPTPTSTLPSGSSITTGIPTPTSASAGTPVSAEQVQYDFASNACSAQWQSNVGVLPCPGKEGDPNGFVLLMDQARLEDGSTIPQPTLLTFPQNSSDGYILAVFPEYSVRAGDHLLASAGCEKDATSCSVLFRISYLDASGAAHDLWAVGEFYDGKYSHVDLDLSPLAGQKVKFVFNVGSLGSPAGDRALWVDPRIARFPVAGPTATGIPTATVPATATIPPATLTASPAPTASPVPTAQPVVPTPPASTPNQPPSIQQVFDSIISFFRQLFGIK